MTKILISFRAFVIGALALATAGALGAVAQGFTFPGGTQVLGMFSYAGKPPVGVGCTIGAGSSDAAGTCLTTATSGSITFGTAKTVAPSCIVVDRTATPVAVYSVSTTAITLSTVTSAHNLVWSCSGNAGG